MTAKSAPNKLIAVLPFENLSADGIQEEILTPYPRFPN